MNGLTCKARCIGVYLRKSQRTNKQSKFPRFAPPTRGNPWGTRWRSLSANQNRLNWGQRTNSPLISSFQSPASRDLLFLARDRIIRNKIWRNWLRGHQHPSEVSGFGSHLLGAAKYTHHRLCWPEKHVTTLKEVFHGPVCYVQKSIMQAARGTGCNNKFYYIPMLLNTCTGILRAFIHGWMK